MMKDTHKACKAPRGANSWGFLLRLDKPFADVVGNYTSHNRDDK